MRMLEIKRADGTVRTTVIVDRNGVEVPDPDVTPGSSVGTGIATPGRITFYKDPLATNLGPAAISPSLGGGGNGGNPYLYVGYNIDAPGWDFINPSDKAAFFGVEGNYDDGSGNNKMEMYGQWQFVAGKVGDVYRRSFMSQFDKVTNLITGTQVAGGPTYGVDLNVNDGAGTATEKVIGKVRFNVGYTVNTSVVGLYSPQGLAVGSDSGVNSSYAVNVAHTLTNVEGGAGMNVAAAHVCSSAKSNAYGSIHQPIFSSVAAKLANPSGLYMKAYTKPQMGASGTVAHDTLCALLAGISVYPGATLGTVTNAIVMNILAPNNEATAPTVIFARSDGVRIANMGVVGGNAGVTVQSARGLVIDDQSGGTVSSTQVQMGLTSVPAGGLWAVYSSTANKSYFSGKMLFGSGTDDGVHQVQVTGSLKATTRYDLPAYTVATLPSAATAGGMIYVSDAATAPCLAVTNGTNWKRCDNMGTTVS